MTASTRPSSYEEALAQHSWEVPERYNIAEGRELGDVTTLRDPDVMSQLGDKVRERQAGGEE